MPRLDHRLTLADRFTGNERVLVRVIQTLVNRLAQAVGQPAVTTEEIREAVRHAFQAERKE